MSAAPPPHMAMISLGLASHPPTPPPHPPSLPTAAKPPLLRLRSTRSTRSGRSSRTHSPIDFSPVETSQIPHTSLYRYPSNSSLASLHAGQQRDRASRSLSRHGSRSRSRHSSTRSSSPAAGPPEDVTMYTAVIPHIPGVPPTGPLPPTPPPGEIDNPLDKAKDDDSEVEELQGRTADSLRRSLRRVRGSITTPTELLQDDECMVAEVEPVTSGSRRGSVQLHHPKSLKGSPKSAYFQDGNFAVEGQMRRDSNTLAFEDLPLPRIPLMIEPGPETVTSPNESEDQFVDAKEVQTELEETEQSDGGVEIEDDDEEEDSPPPMNAAKQRIFGKMGKKVTPWPTPRLQSYENSALGDGGPHADVMDLAGAVNDRVEEEKKDEKKEKEKEEETKAVIPASSIPARRSSLPCPTSAPKTEQKDKPVTRSYSQSRHRSLSLPKDAFPQPLIDAASGLPPNPKPESKPDSDAEKAKDKQPSAGKKQEEEQKGNGKDKDKDRIVLIYKPSIPGPSVPEPKTPPRSLPVLNLIPATPMPLTPAAEKDKQLGVRSLLSRQPTANGPVPSVRPGPTRSTTSSEQPKSDPTSAPTSSSAPDPKVSAHKKRPSLTAIPQKMRESKLHPWWRPKSLRVEDEEGRELERVLSAPSTVSVEDENGIRRIRRVNSLGEESTAGVDGKGPRKKGRVQKRIMGTRLVVEFIGWRGLGEVIKNSVPRKRKMSLRQKSTAQAAA